MSDPHEAQRTENALLQSPAAWRALLESAAEGVVIVDDRGLIRLVNRSAERMFGYGQAELLGRSVEVLLPEDLRSAHLQHRAGYFAAPRNRPMGQGLDLAARRKDGTEFPVEISLSSVDTDTGRFVMALISDITRRRRAERRLRTEFAITQVLAEGLPIREAASRLLGAICECLGWELGELWRVDADANVLRWVGSWHAPALDGAAFTALSREMTFGPDSGIPGRVWASGRALWMSDVTEETCFVRAAEASRAGLRAACGFPVAGREGLGAVAVFFSRVVRQPDPELLDLVGDVASRVGLYIDYQRTREDLERQGEILRQREKLAELGTLAAGLAHEINNPMGIIASRIELMLMESDSNGLPAQTREDLEVLQRNVRRVGQIVRGLLAFARQAPRDRTPVDLNLAVEETLRLVEGQMRRVGVEVRTLLDRTIPALLGDASALEQVTLNLLTNAREALAGPGRVTIETRAAPGRSGWIQLVIADTGPGIPAEALPKIFDPFFTTKPQGTGLGLSLCYGIVQDHGGMVDVESAAGRGTTFILSFPTNSLAPGSA
jgi:two-component system cell cycle sensor histidine kinase/response regulator CckA